MKTLLTFSLNLFIIIIPSLKLVTYRFGIPFSTTGFVMSSLRHPLYIMN